MESEYRTVQLPESLCRAAEQRFGKRFATVQELVMFILQEVVKDDVAQMDEAEKSVIEKRLSDLGYI